MNSYDPDIANEPVFVLSDASDKRALARLTSSLKGMMRHLASSLGGIYFLPSLYGGLFLWLMFAQNPRLGAFALGGLVMSYGIARFLHLPQGGIGVTVVTANALMAAIAVGWLTAPLHMSVTAQIVFVILIVAMVSIVAAASWQALRKTSLPPLGLSYSLIAGILFSLFPEQTLQAAKATSMFASVAQLDNWFLIFLQSLGNVVYMPLPQVGLIVAISLLAWSRTMFVMGFVGWCAGLLVALSLESMGVNYLYLLAAHNYFFAGMVASSVILLPGRWSFVIAAGAGAGASLLAATFQHLLGQSGFAFLPLPSILMIWLVIGALAPAIEKHVFRRNEQLDMPPEEAWWRASYWAHRAGYPDPFVGVPVAGEVAIVQGFNGKFSHKGPWRHALDFQRPASDVDDSEYTSSTWGTPVYSPVAGMVEIAKDVIFDNRLGQCNYTDNWGNHIIIRLDNGGWLLLGHFRLGTIAFNPGARVVEGDYLGEIGNSGRSPYPHLHMQVQNSCELGAPTIPFRLANYIVRDPNDPSAPKWVASGLPAQGTLLKLGHRNNDVLSILSSVSPGEAVWHLEVSGKPSPKYRPRRIKTIERIEIALDEAGRHVFKDRAGNYLTISVDYDAWRIVECKPGRSLFLRLLALCSTAIPHASSKNMVWDEPLLLIPGGSFGWLALLLAPYRATNFDHAKSKCLHVPDSIDRRLTVETSFDGKASDYPAKVTSDWELLRGPTRLEADFLSGRISLVLQSFTPRLLLHHD